MQWNLIYIGFNLRVVIKCKLFMSMFMVEDPYVLSGFMALQIAIEKSFVGMWTNPTLPKIAEDVSFLQNTNTKF